MRLLAILITFGIAACEPEQTVSDANGCGQGQSRINIGDGVFTALCGCSEGDNVNTVGSGTFTCTVSSPRTIIFSFTSATLQHQIESTGSGALSFPSSPVTSPPGGEPHGITLSTTGDYPFRDAFHPSLSGVLRVR